MDGILTSLSNTLSNSTASPLEIGRLVLALLGAAFTLHCLRASKQTHDLIVQHHWLDATVFARATIRLEWGRLVIQVCFIALAANAMRTPPDHANLGAATVGGLLVLLIQNITTGLSAVSFIERRELMDLLVRRRTEAH